MIRYFREGLRPSVRVKMKQRGQELDSFEELVEKAVTTEAKAAPRLRFYARETNQHCLRGSRPLAAKANTQGQPMKDPKVEKRKSKPQESKAPALQRSDNAETSEKARKEKKKNDWKHRQSRRSDDESPRATTANGGKTTNNSAGRSRPQMGFSIQGIIPGIL